MSHGAGRGSRRHCLDDCAANLPIAIAGIVCGLGSAAGLARLLRGLLYEIDPADPATFAGVTAIVWIVATLAAVIPARRAMRVDPMVALRHE